MAHHRYQLSQSVQAQVCLIIDVRYLRQGKAGVQAEWAVVTGVSDILISASNLRCVSRCGSSQVSDISISASSGVRFRHHFTLQCANIQRSEFLLINLEFNMNNYLQFP